MKSNSSTTKDGDTADLNETGAIAELLAAGRAIGTHQNPGAGVQRYTVVPKDYELKALPLAPLLALPDHIRQQVKLQDAESFIAYVKAFRTSTARIFAAAVNFNDLKSGHAGGASFTALLDYHEAGKEDAAETATTATATAIQQSYTKARRVAHVARYPVPLSVEFSTWLGKNGQAFPQMDFINFIEANGPDIQSPDSASLMELALNFEASSTGTFQSKIDRVTGGRRLNFQEEVTAGAPNVGQIKVPETLTLLIPIFEGGKAYNLSARLEYRTGNGKLTIAYILQRPHQVFRAALKDLHQEISEAIGLPILTGEAALTPGWDEPK